MGWNESQVRPINQSYSSCSIIRVPVSNSVSQLRKFTIICMSVGSAFQLLIRWRTTNLNAERMEVFLSMIRVIENMYHRSIGYFQKFSIFNFNVNNKYIKLDIHSSLWCFVVKEYEDTDSLYVYYIHKIILYQIERETKVCTLFSWFPQEQTHFLRDRS